MISMKNIEVVILGAGIGGLCTAIALHQQGFMNFKIFERRLSASTIGAGIVLWSNAGNILEKLNVLDEIKKTGGILSKMQRWSSKGEFLNEMDIEGIDKKEGYLSYSISRKTFHEILLNRIKELNIEVLFGYNVSNISTSQNTSEAIVELDNNKTITADVIVGADGRMKSEARKYVHGNSTPVYQNYVNWVGLIEHPSPFITENNILDYWGSGERFGLVPLSENKAYWAGCKILPAGMEKSEVSDKTTLMKIFKDWPSPIASIIQETNDSFIKRIEVYDHDPIDKWYRNNVCLLGDAAHAALPTSGQGACQAIEDAWCFANCLSQSSNNIKLTFSNYQQLRKKKTSEIIYSARKFSQLIFKD